MYRKFIFLVALIMVGFLIYVICSSTGVVASQEWKNVTANDATVDGLATDVDIGQENNLTLDKVVAQTILLEVAAKDCDIGAAQNSEIVEVIELAKLTVDSPGLEEPMAKAWQNVEKMATAPRETCMTETALAKKVKKKTDVEVAEKVMRDEVDVVGTIWATVANGQRAPSTSSNGTCTCDTMVLLLCA